jgi:SAM-dependent methyltransferase
MSLKQLAFGVATHIPGVYELFRRRDTGGTCSARYCYGVWLRHLIMAQQYGYRGIPRIVAELGPGDSLGTGLAALLSGAERYVAFDVVKYAAREENLRIFDELVELFSARAPIPDPAEFPEVVPPLADYEFPATLLTEEHLSRALDPERVARLRDAVMQASYQEGPIAYVVPWWNPSVMSPGSVDMIFSQAVLEHIDDLERTYAAMRTWLKEDGIATHSLDYRSHNLTRRWNGHWGYSELKWKLLRGKRTYLINRQPHSAHVAMMRRHGFEVRYEWRGTAPDGLRRHQLAAPFRDMSDEDLITNKGFVVTGIARH